MASATTIRINRETIQRYLRDPQPCRCCGQIPSVTKTYWNARHTLWNWTVACQNPECGTQPFFEAYSWDDREMAIARWNDAWGR